jgi:hypothetical protein
LDSLSNPGPATSTYKRPPPKVAYFVIRVLSPELCSYLHHMRFGLVKVR